MKYKYLVSIVMAVYNSELYLRETLDSILAQELQWIRVYDENGERVLDENGKPVVLKLEECVQVIMVDDGSTDSSGEICDEYAANYPSFTVIHKENGGVASARNEGMKYIEGKYMNFLDSDDKFSRNAITSMVNFMEEKYELTDVVTMPIYYFDKGTGQHWANFKFDKGRRVIKLHSDYKSLLMFVNASLFKSEYKDKVKFDGSLVCGEDIKFICEILSEKMTLGVVNNSKYFYRRRAAGEESLIQSAKKKLGWYTDYFTCLFDWCVKFTREKWGYIPYFYQYMLASDLAWRFREDYESNALAVLGEDGIEQYKQTLSERLRYIDDKIIMELKDAYREHKCFMLQKKYGRTPDMVLCDKKTEGNILLKYENTNLFWLSDCYTKIYFINIANNSVIIEGSAMMLGLSEGENIKLEFMVKPDSGEAYYVPCEIIQHDPTIYWFGEALYKGYTFKVEIKLPDERIILKLVTEIRGQVVVNSDLRFTNRCVLTNRIKSAYYIKNGYAVSYYKHKIFVAPVRKSEKHEDKLRFKDFRKELKASTKFGYKNAARSLEIYKIAKKFKRDQIWLISDRADKADDNGEVFYKYLLERKPKGIKPYFVINGDCEDYKRLSEIGNVLAAGSRKHRLIHLLADVIISSGAEENVYNPFPGYKDPYDSILEDKPFVFLQHGITKDDLSGWLTRYNKNITGFVTAANGEYRSIIDYNYYYSSENVWLTGFARYDLLYNDPKKYITIMPTWRKYLAEGIGNFEKSEYYKFYHDLLNDKEFIDQAEKLGYSLRFLLHPRMAKYSESFDVDERVSMVDNSESYRKLFAEGSLLLTDYSSVAFDFAYLRKPVVYCQFDKEQFINGEHMYVPGYFDYERDGLGEVTYDLKSTAALLLDYMKNNCQLKDKYLKRIDSFYAFNDKNNCQRIFDKIAELTGYNNT